MFKYGPNASAPFRQHSCSRKISLLTVAFPEQVSRMHQFWANLCAVIFPGCQRSIIDNVRCVLGWIATIVAGATLVYVVCIRLRSSTFKATDYPLVFVFLALWTIVPPAFFWFEYYVVWKPEQRRNPTQSLDEFKHGQELSRNVWLAVLAFLTLAVFKLD